MIVENMDSFKKYHLSINDLAVDIQFAGPLLGYQKEMPEDIFLMVKEVFDESSGCFDINGGYQLFDSVSFLENGKQIRIDNVDFSPDKIVFHQLKHSEQIAVFVCTAGENISQWSKQMMDDGDPLQGFMADILGSAVVETAIDIIQQKLHDEMEQAGFKITNRYSPGYGGWHTSEQHKLFSLFPKDICGIRLTDSALMLPIKSVSGFIGIGSNVRFNPYTCQLCEALNCVYRNRKPKTYDGNS
jgi:hypothetical protein